MIDQFKSIFPFARKPKSIQIISYPKSGRTWLTVMVGEYIKRKYKIEFDDILEIHKYTEGIKHIVPVIKFGHDDRPLWKTPEELERDKSKFKDDNVLLLVRDPKDVIVSAYFERTKRVPTRRKDLPVFEGTISDYIKQEVGGIETIVEFYNIWLLNSHVPRGFKIVKYEDLLADTYANFTSILDFFGFKNIDMLIVKEVIDFSSFENMQRLEKENFFSSKFLRPGDVSDVESFKVRKGKVGGYADYLTEDEIDYLNGKIKARMNPMISFS